MVIFIVVSTDLVHGVYDRHSLAERHAKCITGCTVVPAEIRSELPSEIRDDIAIDNDYDLDEDTPVDEMEIDERDKVIVDIDDIE